MSVASAEDGIKLTQTGQLNRKFVQEFWDRFLSGKDYDFRPTREFDCPESSRACELLLAGKYIRRFRGAICLTPKGQRVLDEGVDTQFYRDLLMAGSYRWNWAYEDRFPDYDFIQGSVGELLEWLWNWPNTRLTAIELAEDLFSLIDENGRPAPLKYDKNASYKTETYEGFVRCLNLRFFERFCVPFGLLRDPGRERLSVSPEDPYEKTEFFLSKFPEVLKR